MFTMEAEAVEAPEGEAAETLGISEARPDAERALHMVRPAERHEHLIEALDRAHERLGRAQRDLLGVLGQLEGTGAWAGHGARDGAHWVSMRYGVSMWKAHRLLGAARRLPQLPKLGCALATGVLGLDKTLELARFATAATEGELIGWAREVSCATVRRRGEVATQVEPPAEAQRARSLSWWWTDAGARLGLEAELPAEQGSIVVATLQAMAEQVPVMPGEAGGAFAGARRADALVALCTARGTVASPERPTLVVHAPWGAMRRLLAEDPTFTEEPAAEGQDTVTGAEAPTQAPTEGAEALDGARPRPGCRSARGFCSGCCAPRGSRPCSPSLTPQPPAGGTVGTPGRGSGSWRSDAPPAGHRPGCCVRSATATGAAGSPGAAPGPSPRPITSCGGPVVARPSSTTCCCSARSTIASCTSSAGRCVWIVAGCGGGDLTAPATARVQHPEQPRPATLRPCGVPAQVPNARPPGSTARSPPSANSVVPVT